MSLRQERGGLDTQEQYRKTSRAKVTTVPAEFARLELTSGSLLSLAVLLSLLLLYAVHSDLRKEARAWTGLFFEYLILSTHN